jgi:hypothetical protein
MNTSRLLRYKLNMLTHVVRHDKRERGIDVWKRIKDGSWCTFQGKLAFREDGRILEGES